MMQRLNLFGAFFLAVCLLILVQGKGYAQGVPPQVPQPVFGDTVCQPDYYTQSALECIPAGPSDSIKQFYDQGIPYPILDLPASHPSSELIKLDVSFAKVNIDSTEAAAVYSTLDDAVAGQNPSRYIPAGENVWVGFKQRTDVNGGHYVFLTTGEWMRASPAGLNYFSGLVFHQQPRNSFGWVLDFAVSRTAPGYQSPEILEKKYQREDVVQIYRTENKDDTTWYQVGLNEWIERRYIRQLVVNSVSPAGVDNGRWIEINLYEQTLSVYDQNRLVYATLIATGAEPYYTSPGLHKVELKKPSETMTGAFAADKSDYYHLGDVPWTIYFFHSQAIHGAYWRAWFGYPQSHGCVNLSLIDARWLYDWAKEGDYIYIWDPSGETPTDPKFYESVGSY